MIRRLSTLAGVLVLTLALAPLPVANAHCPPGTAGSIAGLVSTCPLNESLEEVVTAFNEANDGLQAIVLVKDFRFHPEVVRLKSGGTVHFVYADTDWAQQHDPRSSGPCADGAPSADDPLACVPTVKGKCFDVARDMRTFQKAPGDVYSLTLKYEGGTLYKSMGTASGTPVVGEPPYAQNFRPCPGGSSFDSADQAIIPYHCGVHGDSETAIKEMRGAIIVEA